MRLLQVGLWELERGVVLVALGRWSSAQNLLLRECNSTRDLWLVVG